MVYENQKYSHIAQFILYVMETRKRVQNIEKNNKQILSKRLILVFNQTFINQKRCSNTPYSTFAKFLGNFKLL